MTIWFSTNIPEMRAISTFKRVSTDISNIQERITSGQRINSGKDDPGGLIIREGLRADIKDIHATQANMVQAENLMDAASSGMMQLLEIIRGSEVSNPDDSGLLGALLTASSPAAAKEAAEGFMKLYDAAIKTTMYNGLQLLGGQMGAPAVGDSGLAPGGSGTAENDAIAAIPGRIYQLGGEQTLEISIANLSSDPADPALTAVNPNAPAGAANALKVAIGNITDEDSLKTAIAAARALQADVSAALGSLGGSQKVVAQNQKLLDSRLTSVTASEGRISNADIAIESSRMARAELLAQNAMSSIMYTRSYAAFSVSSLFG